MKPFWLNVGLSTLALAALIACTSPSRGGSDGDGDENNSNSDINNVGENSGNNANNQGNNANNQGNNGDPNNGDPNNGDPNNGDPNNGDPNNGDPNNNNPPDLCVSVCERLGACPQLEERCPPEFAASLSGACAEGCQDEEARAQIEAANGLRCEQLVDLAIAGFDEEGVCTVDDRCVDVLCETGTRCVPETGDCVDVCFDVACDPDSACDPVTGECVVVPALCQDVVCDEGQSCDPETGMCVDDGGDLCQDVVCEAGESCDPETGMCVEDDVNPCEDVVCDEGESCDSETGMCVNRCEGVACLIGVCDPETGACVECLVDGDCNEGSTCNADNACVGPPGLCEGVVCEEGEVCDQETGMCVDDGGDLCEGVVCEEGESCDPQSGSCIEDGVDLCQDVVCEDGEVCDSQTGMCVNLCEGVACLIGVCDPETGGCVDCVQDGDCDEGQTCTDDNFCDGCTTDDQCPNGVCSPLGSCVECVNDDHCVDGVCTPLGACVECTDDSHCDSGSCNSQTSTCEAADPCVDTFDPNDSRASATRIAAQRYTELVACEDDWFSIDVEEGQSLRASITFRDAIGDLDLELYGAGANHIDNAISATDNEHVAGVNLAAGTYYIRVFPFTQSNSNTYTLEVGLDPTPIACLSNQDCGGAQCNQDLRACGVECNGTQDCDGGAVCVEDSCVACTDDAQCLGGDRCVAGRCEPAQCADDPHMGNHQQSDAIALEPGYYPDLFICNDEDWYSFTLEEGDDLRVVAEFIDSEGDLELDLFNPGGQRIARGESLSDNEYVGVVNATAGVYTLRVYGYGSTTDTYATYALDVDVNPTDFTVCVSDAQCTAPEVCSEGSYTCTAECVVENDCPFGEVCTAEGSCVECVTTDDCSNGGFCNQDNVCAFCAEDAECGEGNSCVNGDCVPSFCAADPLEPNDTLQTPAMITTGAPITELAICGEDEDYFVVELTQAGSIWVAVEFVDDVLDIDARLLDANGNQLDSSISTNDNEYLGYANLSPGMYIVRVFTFLSGESLYQLTVEVDPAFEVCNPDAPSCMAGVCDTEMRQCSP